MPVTINEIINVLSISSWVSEVKTLVLMAASTLVLSLASTNGVITFQPLTVLPSANVTSKRLAVERALSKIIDSCSLSF